MQDNHGVAQTHQEEDDRLATVIKAAKIWQKQLVDATGRNRLLRYRDLKTGTLNLTPGEVPDLDSRVLDRMLDGKKVWLSDLFHQRSKIQDDFSTFPDASRRLQAIRRSALTNLEEKGIETLYMAVGLAAWDVDAGTTKPNAPVVLIPISIETSGAVARDSRLAVTGEAYLNPVLTHFLRTVYGIDTEDDNERLTVTAPSNLSSFVAYLDSLQRTLGLLRNLSIEPRVLVSNFSYSTLPLVSDIEKNHDILAEHDLIAAIAGNGEARKALVNRVYDADPRQPDTESSSEEFLVLDADSSQHLAINRVLAGESLVIQGPPGTGKSQTIANLIVALMAKGKRVLFVAEKRAAIEAVTKRLEHTGLGDLIMDLHGGIKSRREFARSLNDALQKVSAIPAQDYSHLHRRLERSKSTLIANDVALHIQREPWKLSVYEMRSRLLKLPITADCSFQITNEEARKINRNNIDDIAQNLGEWAQLGGSSLATDHPEWSKTKVSTSYSARSVLETAQYIAWEKLPKTREVLFKVLDEFRLNRPNTIDEWVIAVDFLAIASGPWWRRLMARLFSKHHRSTGQALGGTFSVPLDIEQLMAVTEDVYALIRVVDNFVELSGLQGLRSMPWANLSASFDRMASSSTTAANLPRIRELERYLSEIGLGGVMERIHLSTDSVAVENAFEYAWLSRSLEEIDFEDRTLVSFNSDLHTRRLDEFVEADIEHLDSNAQRVQRLVAEAAIVAMDEHPDQAMIVKREAAKRSRHMSVRQLIANAPDVLSSIRPCWTMSPILVSEMLPWKVRLFDTVIFDEASQIPPAEAIGSLARAPQAVIAGDSLQLPPTSFFGRSSGHENEAEDEDEFALTGDIESILDTAAVLLPDQMLLWHYRSQDDRLIGFSNHNFYSGSLTTFPGATLKTPIEHCLVPFRPITWVSGTRSNPDEVEKVVELILEHAHKTPDETLGVIAFGQYHADNIERTLMARLGSMYDSTLDAFFAESNEERFFVKNIERVQGDERDAIILSVGYHKDPNGNLPYRFGPILHEGGERRLNVAITRARTRLTLVSSFTHHDMDPNRSSKRGVELLRSYLEYAASGGDNLGSTALENQINSFELDIKDGLEHRGIPVKTRYGVSGYRIDFACAHPEEPGQMVLAIEVDGTSYHSAHTARDRDRIRQQVLESKGWQFHRIWSTAWFHDREAELDKAEEAWKRAVAASDNRDYTAPEDRAHRLESSHDQMNPEPPVRRGHRPNIPKRGTPGYYNITDYEHSQLVSLAKWIQSDTLLRTNEDLVKEMMTEIGFKRSGSRIREAITWAIIEAQRLSGE